MIASISEHKTALSPKIINYMSNNLPNEIFEDRSKLVERMKLDRHQKAAAEIEAMSNEDYDYFIINILP